MTDLTDLSLIQAVHLMRKGEISSEELTRAYLERIHSLEPMLHAFITLIPEKALEAARTADRLLQTWRRDTSQPLPALIGAPLVIKDVLCLKDVRCTCGSLILENFIPPFNATAVEVPGIMGDAVGGVFGG